MWQKVAMVTDNKSSACNPDWMEQLKAFCSSLTQNLGHSSHVYQLQEIIVRAECHRTSVSNHSETTNLFHGSVGNRKSQEYLPNHWGSL